MALHVIHGLVANIEPAHLSERQIHNCIMDTYIAIDFKEHLQPGFIKDKRLWGTARVSINGLLFDFSNLGLTIERVNHGISAGRSLEVATDLETYFTFTRSIFDQATIHFVSLLTLSAIDKSFQDIKSFENLKDLSRPDFMPLLKPFIDAFVALRHIRGLFMHHGVTPIILQDKFSIGSKLPSELAPLQGLLGITNTTGNYIVPILPTIKYFTTQTNETLNTLGAILKDKLHSYTGAPIPCNTAIEGDFIPPLKKILNE